MLVQRTRRTNTFTSMNLHVMVHTQQRTFESFCTDLLPATHKSLCKPKLLHLGILVMESKNFDTGTIATHPTFTMCS